MRFNSERKQTNIRDALELIDNILKSTFERFVSINIFLPHLQVLKCGIRQEIPLGEGMGYLLLIKLSPVTVMER